MDTLNNYQTIIRNIFSEYANTRIPINNSTPGYQLIFDTERDSYLLYRTGWKEELKRIHFCVFHVDIIDGKVWVQENASDLVGALEDEGISRENIVLGFQAPYKRGFTEYAVA
jgi:hypothetical protein